jgi:hypothetical protein
MNTDMLRKQVGEFHCHSFSASKFQGEFFCTAMSYRQQLYCHNYVVGVALLLGSWRDKGTEGIKCCIFPIAVILCVRRHSLRSFLPEQHVY